MCHSLLNQSVVNHAIDEWRRRLSTCVDAKTKPQSLGATWGFWIRWIEWCDRHFRHVTGSDHT